MCNTEHTIYETLQSTPRQGTEIVYSRDSLGLSSPVTIHAPSGDGNFYNSYGLCKQASYNPRPVRGRKCDLDTIRRVTQSYNPRPVRGRKYVQLVNVHQVSSLQSTPRQGTAMGCHVSTGILEKQLNYAPPGDKTRRRPHANGIGALFDLHVIYFTAGSTWLSFSSAAEPSASEVFSDDSVCKFSSSVFKRTFVNVALA